MRRMRFSQWKDINGGQAKRERKEGGQEKGGRRRKRRSMMKRGGKGEQAFTAENGE